MVRVHLRPREAPAPVAFGLAGEIHAVRAIEAEDVLQRVHSRVGHAGARRADEVPADVAAIAGEVLAHVVSHVFGRRLPPADRGVVVVRAGVHHSVAFAAVRQVMRVSGRALSFATTLTPRELQHAHAGEGQRLAQLLDLGCDHAKIFGNDGQRPEGFVDGVEQGSAWALHPSALDCDGLAGCDLPVRQEAAKVIDAHDIDKLEGASYSLGPPSKTFLLVRAPAVQGVAPALAGGAEQIRRHAGHHRRPQVAAKLEEFGPRPDVCALLRNEDRHVTHDPDATLVGIGLQEQPLAEESPLAKLPEGDALCMLLVGRGHRCGSALRECGIPLAPVASVEVLGQGHESGVVV